MMKATIVTTAHPTISITRWIKRCAYTDGIFRCSQPKRERERGCMDRARHGVYARAPLQSCCSERIRTPDARNVMFAYVRTHPHVRTIPRNGGCTTAKPGGSSLFPPSITSRRPSSETREAVMHASRDEFRTRAVKGYGSPVPSGGEGWWAGGVLVRRQRVARGRRRSESCRLPFPASFFFLVSSWLSPGSQGRDGGHRIPAASRLPDSPPSVERGEHFAQRFDLVSTVPEGG
jgi:hypothetical protein